MNKLISTPSLLLALFVLTLFSARLLADEASGITVNPYFGWTISGDEYGDSRIHKGFGIGYQFDSPWALEFAWQTNNLDEGVFNARVESRRVDLLYHINTSSSIWSDDLRPFLSFGAGRVEYDFNSRPDSLVQPVDFEETQYDVGFGFKWDWGQRTSVRSDFRVFHDRENDNTDATISLGMHHVFGKVAPVSVAAVPRAEIVPADEPEPYVEPEPVADVKTVSLPVRITLDLKFDFDSSAVRQESAPQVSEVAEFMREYLTTTATLEGHTDSRGSAEYNLGLSERRARAVADMLSKQFGIAAERLTTKGFGASQPIDTNETKAGRQNNRRVVTVIEAEKQVQEVVE